MISALNEKRQVPVRNFMGLRRNQMIVIDDAYIGSLEITLKSCGFKKGPRKLKSGFPEYSSGVPLKITTLFSGA
jgi:hypothetical protein